MMISPTTCSTTSTSTTTTTKRPPTSSILINKDSNNQPHHQTPIITFQQAAADRSSKRPTVQFNSVQKSKTESPSIMKENPPIFIPINKNDRNSADNFEEVCPEESRAVGLSGIESHFFEGVEKLLEVFQKLFSAVILVPIILGCNHSGCKISCFPLLLVILAAIVENNIEQLQQPFIQQQHQLCYKRVTLQLILFHSTQPSFVYLLNISYARSGSPRVLEVLAKQI